MTLPELEPRAQVLALARLISPAVRVEPDRLRAVRLACLPRSAAALEADLWSSPLVQVRNADGLVLRPDVIAILREELIGDARVPALRVVHEPFRRTLPPLLAIEEEIVWLALLRADDGVIGHLCSVLKTMMAHPERAPGLASWAARALLELPPAVRDTPAALHLDVATCACLGRPIRVDALRAGGNLMELPELLLPELPTVQVAVERRGDQLVLGLPAEPREGARLLDAPATDPVIVVVSAGGATDAVAIRPGVPSVVRVHGDPVTLRTLRGDEWELARRPGGRAAAPRPVFSWIHLSNLLIADDPHGPLAALAPSLVADFERMEGEVGAIGALFVTGDLTSRGSVNELHRADKFLHQLVRHRNIAVFAVPGNHDDDQSGESQHPYERWWNNHRFGQAVELRHGRVPGDFIATLHAGDTRVGIVGLNTARSRGASTFGFAFGSGFAGNGATLDADQLSALAPDLEAWSAAHDVTVLLTHHRRDIILEDARLDFDRLVTPPGVFDVHLSGGGDWPDEWSFGTTLQVRGRSLRGSSLGRATPPGYWLGRVDRGAPRQARLWARTWSEATGAFEPDRWTRIQHRDSSVAVPLPPRPLSRIPRLMAGEILARLGRGSCVLLYGPPGAGKTTLLDDLAQRLPMTRRIDAADGETLAFLRRERDTASPVIWLVDDVDHVPEAQRHVLFAAILSGPGQIAGLATCFTASSFEAHGSALGVEPIAVPDADQAELALLFARRLAALGAPREAAHEIFAWVGGHVALAARIVEDLERKRHLSVAHAVERAILAPGVEPPLPAPQVGEAALGLYQALLRGEPVPREHDRATAELLASGLAVEAVGETGTDVLRVRSRVIRQVYDQRWVDQVSPGRP
jgi:energy-coupling factor transporter ATP-binding protein EcfA2